MKYILFVPIFVAVYLILSGCERAIRKFIQRKSSRKDR